MAVTIEMPIAHYVLGCMLLGITSFTTLILFVMCFMRGRITLFASELVYVDIHDRKTIVAVRTPVEIKVLKAGLKLLLALPSLCAKILVLGIWTLQLALMTMPTSGVISMMLAIDALSRATLKTLYRFIVSPVSWIGKMAVRGLKWIGSTCFQPPFRNRETKQLSTSTYTVSEDSTKIKSLCADQAQMLKALMDKYGIRTKTKNLHGRLIMNIDWQKSSESNAKLLTRLWERNLKRLQPEKSLGPEDKVLLFATFHLWVRAEKDKQKFRNNIKQAQNKAIMSFYDSQAA